MRTESKLKLIKFEKRTKGIFKSDFTGAIIYENGANNGGLNNQECRRKKRTPGVLYRKFMLTHFHFVTSSSEEEKFGFINKILKNKI